MPSIYEPEGFIRHFEEQVRDDEPLITTPESVDGQISREPVEGINVVEHDVLEEMFLKMTNMWLSRNKATLTREQCELLKIAGESFMTILDNAVELEPRPSRVPMPREGGSITPIQARVTNTRLGHGSQKKKRKLNEEESGGGEESILQSSRPSGIKVLRRREIVKKKRTRVKLPKLWKEECSECSALNIFFDGVTNTECHNCQHVIRKGGDNIAQDKGGCEVDQDVELFFKDLEIY